jgi:dihydrodipicolinate synthase/N-acetylneuraminate lyase
MHLPQAKADLPRWTGVFPAVTTKFKPNEDLDLAEMERHFEFQIAGGVSAIIQRGLDTRPDLSRLF